jgi:hypothetical protein
VTSRAVGPTVPPTMPGGDMQIDDGFWEALGDRAIHPVRLGS